MSRRSKLSQRSSPTTDLKTAWLSRPTYSAPRAFMVFAFVRSNASAIFMMWADDTNTSYPFVGLDDLHTDKTWHCHQSARKCLATYKKTKRPTGMSLSRSPRQKRARTACPSRKQHSLKTILKNHTQHDFHKMFLQATWSAAQTIQLLQSPNTRFPSNTQRVKWKSCVHGSCRNVRDGDTSLELRCNGQKQST